MFSNESKKMIKVILKIMIIFLFLVIIQEYANTAVQRMSTMGIFFNKYIGNILTGVLAGLIISEFLEPKKTSRKHHAVLCVLLLICAYGEIIFSLIGVPNLVNMFAYVSRWFQTILGIYLYFVVRRSISISSTKKSRNDGIKSSHKISSKEQI